MKLDRIPPALRRQLDIRPRPMLPLGGEGPCAAFPEGALGAGSHQCAPVASGDEAAALAFAVALTIRALAARPGSRALLVQSAEAAREAGWAYGAGLQALGLDPDRLGVAPARNGAEALRTVDEALRSGSVAAVLADLWAEPRLDLTATRRFNLTAERTGGSVFLVTRDLAGTSAALTRWAVAAHPSLGLRRRLERPTFQLQLLRNRMGPTGEWTVEWDSDDRVFRAPSALPFTAPRPLADRPAAAAHPQPGLAAGAFRQAG